MQKNLQAEKPYILSPKYVTTRRFENQHLCLEKKVNGNKN